MTEKKTIRALTGEEREQFVGRLRDLARDGRSMTEAAKLLGEVFPGYHVTVHTVKNLAQTEEVKFKGGQVRRTRAVPDEELSVVVEKDREISALKEQNRELGRRYKEALEESTLAQRLIGAAVPATQALGAVEVTPATLRHKEPSTPQAAVCFNSCLHNGEVVSPGATMGLGGFSPEIAAARWEYYVETVLDLALNHHRGERFDKLYVVNVGDNMSGNIHDELKATNRYPLGEQIVRTAHLLALGVRDLAQHFAEVEFVGLVGNHTRFDKKPMFKDKAPNSGDYVAYHQMKALLAGQQNVTVTIPESPWHTMDIQGRRFFFAHGDTIRMYFQFPWYDTRNFVVQFAQLLVAKGEPYPEYWGFGHFHQANISQLSYGEWLFTGSFKGPDEFSVGKLRAGTPPNQLFFGVHERRGVSFRYPVVLTDADPVVQSRYQEVVRA